MTVITIYSYILFIISYEEIDSNFKKHISIVLGVFMMISMVAFGYFLGQHDLLNGQTSIPQIYKTDEAESKEKLFGGIYGNMYDTSNKNAAKELTKKMDDFNN